MTQIITDLYTDAQKVTVRGKGFDMSAPNMNVISNFPNHDNARALRRNVTHTSVVLSFTHLSPLGNAELLRVDVTVQNSWSTQETQTISTLKAVNPSVLDDTKFVRSDSTDFTIQGRGFDALNSEKNAVTIMAPEQGIFNSTSKTTHTSLIVTFTHLSPLNDGNDVVVQVTVSDQWSSQNGGNKATKIQGVDPTVVDDNSHVSSDSPKFTIMGKGFDASAANLHKFSLSGNVKAVLGSSAVSTRNSLEISFTHLSPLDHGLNLNAAVTVNDQYASNSTFSLSKEKKYNDLLSLSLSLCVCVCVPLACMLLRSVCCARSPRCGCAGLPAASDRQ